MVGKDGDGVHGGTRVFLGAGQATRDDRVEPGRRLEQVTPFDRSLGDLDQGPWTGKVSWFSGHYVR